MFNPTVMIQSFRDTSTTPLYEVIPYDFVPVMDQPLSESLDTHYRFYNFMVKCKNGSYHVVPKSSKPSELVAAYGPIDTLIVFDCIRLALKIEDEKDCYFIWLPAGCNFKNLVSQSGEISKLLRPLSDYCISWNNEYFPLSQHLSPEQIVALYENLQTLSLVIKPQKITSRPISSETMDAYIGYENTGKVICSENQISDVFDVIDRVWGWSKKLLATKDDNLALNTPFVAVLLPSYSGKTALTSALNQASVHPLIHAKGSLFYDDYLNTDGKILAVLRFVMSSVKFESQEIYKSLDFFSEALNSAINLDFKILGPTFQKQGESVSGSSLCKESGMKYHTIGLLMCLLKARINGQDRFCLENGVNLDYQAMSISEGRSIVSELAGGLPVVVTLDEYNLGSSNSDQQDRLVFARDIARELGLVVIVLGTDSRAANLILPSSTGGDSRMSGGLIMPWCYLISRLPSATIASLDMSSVAKLHDRFKATDDFKKFFQWISHLSSDGTYAICQNPGILHLFLDVVVERLKKSEKKSVTSVELLKYCFSQTGRQIYNAKFLSKPESQISYTGQFFMILSKFREKDEGMYPAALIHHHFAYLDIKEAPFINKSDESNSFMNGVYELFRTGESLSVPDINGTLITFEPSSLFPLFSQNELLYMILLDTSTMEYICRRNTFATIGKAGHDSMGFKSTGNGNSCITSPRNGCYLENVAQGAAVLSTHQSVAGVPFGQFMVYFLKQLGSGHIQHDIRVLESESFRSLWNDVMVPYVPCVGVDAKCSDAFLSIPNVFGGVFEQVPNSAMHDGSLCPWLVHMIGKHCQDCEVCRDYGFPDLSKYLTDPALVEAHCCPEMARKLKTWSESGLIQESHLKNLVRILITKNHRSDASLTDLSDIIDRFVLRIESDSPHQALQRHVCIIVATSYNIYSRSVKFRKIAAKFEGSIYMLSRSINNGLEFQELNYNEDSSRICFLIPAEQCLGANFSPFPEKRSSSSV